MSPIASVESARWFADVGPDTHDELRIFCFPYAGGGAGAFRTLRTAAKSVGLTLVPVQLPGRESRLLEQPFTRMPDLVQMLAQVLDPHLHLPFAFFGHSMGALIGFELARELRRRGKPEPVHLFLSAHRAAQFPDRYPPLHRLPSSGFWRELNRLGGTSSAVLRNFELMDLVEPSLRADFAVCETYQYADEPPLDSPISAFGGRDDKRVSCADLTGWRSLTMGNFKIRMVAGDHFFLNTAPLVLAHAIAEDLQNQFQLQSRGSQTGPCQASAAR